jgi:hypothetical protein
MRWDIINGLIDRNKYESYLEIGTQDPTCNFIKIHALNKISVEPFPIAPVSFVGTSDEYFEQLTPDTKFDIIFIDGLHHYDQVLRDISNSLNHLTDNGTILCHDCLPSTQKMQERNDHGGEWTGDVWKAIAILRATNSNITLKTVNTDYGCGIIQFGNSDLISIPDDLTYEFYLKNRSDLFNIISIEEFSKWINLA